MPAMKRAANANGKCDAKAVMALQTKKPPTDSNSTQRRRQPRSATVSGIAASPDPSAHNVTSWPAQPCDTPKSRAILGSSPAGTASLAVAIKLHMVNASKAAIGMGVVAGAGAGVPLASEPVISFIVCIPSWARPGLEMRQSGADDAV
ncbi:hypothetical protein LMG1864_02195 [Achromobacter ruhlandii]|nr:hypothetical protein LMG1864_02195 [Achromobacter ruhlandii]